MDRQQYEDMMYSLGGRLVNARNHHCPKTARARLRDMAKIHAEFRGISYDEAVGYLSKMYKVEMI